VVCLESATITIPQTMLVAGAGGAGGAAPASGNAGTVGTSTTAIGCQFF
jgi:hypothetical protein